MDMNGWPVVPVFSTLWLYLVIQPVEQLYSAVLLYITLLCTTSCCFRTKKQHPGRIMQQLLLLRALQWAI